MTNLVTSCEPCNLGKSNVPLGQVPPQIDLVSVIEKQKELLSQTIAYDEWLKSKTNIHDAWLRELMEYWAGKEGQKGNEYLYHPDVKAAMRKFLRHLTKTEIREGIDYAFERRSNQPWMIEKSFYKFCWNKIKDPKSRTTACM